MLDRMESARDLARPFQWGLAPIINSWRFLSRHWLGATDGSGERSGRQSPDVDSRSFRQAMGHFATGVTVITTDGPDGLHAMTANAVTSVSLDPPLILVCVGHSARLSEYLPHGQRFAVNILGDNQEPESRYFSGTRSDSSPTPRFRFEYFHESPTLTGCITTLICDVNQRYSGGDHDIVLGEVRRIQHDHIDRGPLLFYQGRYASLSRSARSHLLEPSEVAPRNREPADCRESHCWDPIRASRDLPVAIGSRFRQLMDVESQ